MENPAPKTLASGIYAALATPRRKDRVEPDTAAFLDYLDEVIRAGVDGIVLFGSTGEFVHFDAVDRMQTLNLAIRRSRVPVLVNISHRRSMARLRWRRMRSIAAQRVSC